MQVFAEGNAISFDAATGELIQEKDEPRPILKALNSLHLNHPKKLWSVVADFYAVALAVLAVRGLFLVKGKKGLKGRGGVYTALGIVIPIAFALLYGA